MVAVGTREQNTCLTSFGPNDDPAFRPAVIGQRWHVFHQLKPQNVNEETDGCVVVTHDQCDEFEIRHQTVLFQRRAVRPTTPVRARLSRAPGARSRRADRGATPYRSIPPDCRYRFSASATNANTSFVTGSSGAPILSLRLSCVVSRLTTFAEMPAPLSTSASRRACALVSGLPAMWRMRNGGMPLFGATCVTAEKSRCFAGSSPNFWR